ncbi:MAG TPA: hypothetical protein VIN08_01260 [Ohtaekwangia sp.]|uniref:hypothetical protein n=1 Tax=Ohtaekwangia sp. TaxID=2066019 RepID=UPI002F951056
MKFKTDNAIYRRWSKRVTWIAFVTLTKYWHHQPSGYIKLNDPGIDIGIYIVLTHG